MGAWTLIYHEGVSGAPDTPVGAAVIALKTELVYNGFEGRMQVSSSTFGPRMAHQVKRFQTFAGNLTVDGEVGPKTAAALYQKRFSELDSAYHVDNHLICRIAHLESGCDPGAVGVVDPADHGIVQINARAHPELTLADAFDAVFSLGYCARSIARVHALLGDWDCAAAAWNIGGGAAQMWCAAGKPPNLVWNFDDGSTWDYGAQATRYLELLRNQPCQ